MIKPITLGDIRIFDNDGNGVIDFKKDTITPLDNDTPIDERDPAVQRVMRLLGVKNLQGVALSPATAFMTGLSEAKEFAREGNAEKVRAKLDEIIEIANRNGFKFANEAAKKIYRDALVNQKERLRPTELAVAREKEIQAEKRKAAVRAAKIAKAREEAYRGRYHGDADATQKLFGTNFDLTGERQAALDRLPGKSCFLIFEAMVGVGRNSNWDEAHHILDHVTRVAASSAFPFERKDVERAIGEARRTAQR